MKLLFHKQLNSQQKESTKRNQFSRILKNVFSEILSLFYDLLIRLPKRVYVILPSYLQPHERELTLVRIDQLIKEGYQVTIIQEKPEKNVVNIAYRICIMK